MGGSSKGATTTSSAPPPQVMAQYENVINEANQVAQTPYQPYTGQLVADFNPTEEQAFGEIGEAQGISQPYYNAATAYATAGATPITGSDIAYYENPYIQTVEGATLGNLNLLNEQQQANLTSGVEGSGGLFNDRYGVAQAQLAGQQGLNEAPTIANIESQGYSQALQAAQAQQGVFGQAAYTLGSLGSANLSAALQAAQAELGAGGTQQQLTQTQLSTLYNQWQQAQAYPFQDVSWLSGISTGLGSNMGGTSTTTPPLASQIAPYAGLGLAGLALFGKRGGAVPHGLERKRLSAGIDRPHYDFGGPVPQTPWGNVASPYIPGGIQITHGSGPPKPPAAGTVNPLDKVAQDAIKLAGKGGSGSGSAPSMGDDPSYDIVTGGSASGNPGLDLGDAFSGSASGGGISRRRGFDEGGPATDDDYSPFLDARGNPVPESGIPIRADSAVTGIVPRRPTLPEADLAAYGMPPAPVAPPPGTEVVTSAPPAAPAPGISVPAMAAAPTDATAFQRPAWMGSNAATDAGGLPSSAPITAGLGLGDVRVTKRAWPGEDNSTTDWTAPRPKDQDPQKSAPVYTGGNREQALSYGAGIVSAERARNAIGKFESGNDYGQIGVPTKLGRALGRYQVMEKELPAQLREAGLPPMTPQEFLRDHDAQDKLFDAVFVRGLQNKYGSFNEAASMWFSGRTIANSEGRRDALGTTVPMYLANTNAILAKDLGDKVSGLSVPVTDREGRTGTASVSIGDGRRRTDLEEERHHLFSPEVRSALLKAGFALMANRSPYIAQAIGDAGLVGVASYQEAKRYESAQSAQERKLRLSEAQAQLGVRRLDQALALSNERINRDTRRDAETTLWRQSQIERSNAAAEHQRHVDERAAAATERQSRIDAAGKLGEGFRWKNPDDPREQEFIPGGPRDPAVIAAASAAKRVPIGNMSPEVQEVFAREIASGNLSSLAGLPRTPEGLAQRRALQQQAVELIMRERGFNPTQAAEALNRSEQEFKAKGMELNAAARTAGAREANLNIILRATAGAVPAALAASEKVTRYGGVLTPINRLIQHGEIMASDPDQIEFGMANLQLAEHWARAMNPTGVMRESDRDMALKFLDTNLSKGTYERAVRQLQTQMTRERDAIAGKAPDTPVMEGPAPAPGAGTERTWATRPRSETSRRETPARREMTEADAHAVAYAKTHPNDPNSKGILEHWGAAP